MAKVKLPRYVRPIKLAGGATGFYWELPSWAKKRAEETGEPCPVESAPLGTDLAIAIKKAEAINATLDEWRTGIRKAEQIPGTVSWLFAWYRQQDRFTERAWKTRKDYARLMDRLENYKLRTRFFGQVEAAKVEARHADAIYRAFRKHGLREASYAMTVCRLVWKAAKRHHTVTGIKENPFAEMGLKTTAQSTTYAASREEYEAYKAAARKMGYQSMATAAALAFEGCQRETDVFGFIDPDGRKQRGFRWSDYKPGVSIVLHQSKTGRRVEIPLSEGGVQLMPELEEELHRLAQVLSAKGLKGETIVVRESDGELWNEHAMRKVHRKIRQAAGLPKQLSFTTFRHGGLTELGDAGVADVRPFSGHTQLSTSLIYNKATIRKAKAAAILRRSLIDGQEINEDQEGLSVAAPSRAGGARRGR